MGSCPLFDLAGARDRIADHRKLIAKDKDPRAEQRHERRRFVRSEELTFNQLCDKYISEYAKGPGGEEKPEQELVEKRCGLPEEAPPALGASAGKLQSHLTMLPTYWT